VKTEGGSGCVARGGEYHLGRETKPIPILPDFWTDELMTDRMRVLTEIEQKDLQETGRQLHRLTFFSLMRLRGIECRAPGGHAEAFYCRKLVL
jgi:hypothetical protein